MGRQDEGVSELRIGDLFDPDDVVSHWVFALSAAVTDIGIAEAVFADSLGDEVPASRTGYHYRQLIARLYEAERVVIAFDEHEEVRQFVTPLPYANEAIDFLRQAYLPAGD